MPARTTAPPRAFPARFVVARKLPQHEVAGAFLVLIDSNTSTRLLLIQRALGKLAVIAHRFRVEQHFAACHVSMTTRDETLDNLDHLRNIVGGTGLYRRPKAAKFRHVRVKLLRRLFRHGMDGIVQWQVRVITQRARIDLVIDIRDVAGIGNTVFAVNMSQHPVKHIEHDDRASITDMGEVINRGAADIHADIVRIDGIKFGFFAGQRVVKLQTHRH